MGDGATVPPPVDGDAAANLAALFESAAARQEWVAQLVPQGVELVRRLVEQMSLGEAEQVRAAIARYLETAGGAPEQLGSCCAAWVLLCELLDLPAELRQRLGPAVALGLRSADFRMVRSRYAGYAALLDRRRRGPLAVLVLSRAPALANILDLQAHRAAKPYDPSGSSRQSFLGFWFRVIIGLLTALALLRFWHYG